MNIEKLKELQAEFQTEYEQSAKLSKDINKQLKISRDLDERDDYLETHSPYYSGRSVTWLRALLKLEDLVKELEES